MVATIITIIVLLVLAGVALGTAFTGDGIIQKIETSLANSEKMDVYEKVGTSVIHNKDGKINVKATFEAVEKNLKDMDVTIMRPGSKDAIYNLVTFSVEGKRNTYMFKITDTKIYIIYSDDPESGSGLRINKEYEDGYALLEIIPNVTADMLTEEAACKMWTGTSSLAEAMTIGINEILGLEEPYENFEAIAADYINADGLIDIGSMEVDDGSGKRWYNGTNKTV